MSLHPAVAAVRRGVRGALSRLEPGDAVVVACSGGADSLALASATVFEGHKLGLRVVGATVDHGLQPGSADQAARVVAQLVALGVDETATVRVEVVGEDRARRQPPGRRGTTCSSSCASSSAPRWCCSATPATTRPRRCCSASPAAPARGRWPGMRRTFDHYARPLLDVTRDDTVTACQVEGLDAWDDPHNADPGYTRVRVRRTVLPVLEEQLGPGVSAALARTADQLRDDVDALDQLARTAYDALRRERRRPAGRARLRPPPRGRLTGAAAGSTRRRSDRQRALPRPRPGPRRPRRRRRPGRGPAPRPRDRVP